jgi:hypothetical protein
MSRIGLLVLLSTLLFWSVPTVAQQKPAPTGPVCMLTKETEKGVNAHLSKP